MGKPKKKHPVTGLARKVYDTYTHTDLLPCLPPNQKMTVTDFLDVTSPETFEDDEVFFCILKILSRQEEQSITDMLKVLQVATSHIRAVHDMLVSEANRSNNGSAKKV